MRPSATGMGLGQRAVVSGADRHRWRSVVAALVVAMLAVWSLQVPARALDPDAGPVATSAEGGEAATDSAPVDEPEGQATDEEPASAPGPHDPAADGAGGDGPGDGALGDAGSSDDGPGEQQPQVTASSGGTGTPAGQTTQTHDGGAHAAQGSGTSGAGDEGGPPHRQDGPAGPAPAGGEGAGPMPGDDGGDELLDLDGVGHATTDDQGTDDAEQIDSDGASGDGEGTTADGDGPSGDHDDPDDQGDEDEDPGEQGAGEGAGDEQAEPATSTPLDSAEVEAAIETVLDDGVQILHSGNAVAVGNLSDDRVVQVVDVLVFDGARVWVEQIVIIVNIGQAVASSGGNTVAGAVSSGGASSVAEVTTSDAIAIGNASETELDQQLAIDVDEGSTNGHQYAGVTNTGVAIASSGGNVAIAGGTGAGSVAVSTGNAYALGNFADNLIEQGATVAATGSAMVGTDQQSVVVNRGLALADSGDNVALAGSGGLVASSTETGIAFAEGNVSTTTVEQRVVAVATGDASVTMRQGALVLNLGVAWASTGDNQVGALAGPGTVTTSLDELDDDLLSLVLLDLSALDDLAAWFADWLGPIIGHDLTVDAATASEHLVATGRFASSAAADDDAAEDDEGAAHGDEDATTGGIWLRQLALILDLGFASATTGGNVATAASDAADGTPDGVSPAETRATVNSGEAFALGNVAVTLVCQRLRVAAELDARRCAPPPPSPPVRPERPATPVEPGAPELAGPVEITPDVVDQEPVVAEPVAQRPVAEPTPVPLVLDRVAPPEMRVGGVRQAVPVASLPRTGVDADVLGIGGIAAILAGLLALGASTRTPGRRSDRRIGRPAR